MELKTVIVVDHGLPTGLQANMAAVLALSLGRARPELVGADTHDADGQLLPGIVTLPLPVLRTDETELRRLGTHREPGLHWSAVYTAAALKSKTYAAYSAALANARIENLPVHAVLLFGERRTINRLSGGFRLL